MKQFTINKEYAVVCRSEDTRYGFRHLATLLHNGNERFTVKSCYYNRTWERYEFETVLSGVLTRSGLFTQPKVTALLEKFSHV